MNKDDQLKIRLSSELKKRIKKAARVQGLNLSEYIRDRIEPHLDADLSDLRKLLEEDEQYQLAA